VTCDEFASPRCVLVLVPQEGFLFDASLLENTRWTTGSPVDDAPGAHRAGADEGQKACPGLDTASASVRRCRQAPTVVIVRAYLADPDLLVS
jgi:putative ABC transport system ATP-binding protein